VIGARLDLPPRRLRDVPPEYRHEAALDRFVRSAWLAVIWLVAILAAGGAVDALGL
jgi:hypothetical protein